MSKPELCVMPPWVDTQLSIICEFSLLLVMFRRLLLRFPQIVCSFKRPRRVVLEA